MFLLGLKRAIGFKTSYGDAFGKLVAFFDQKYHTLENIITKTQLKWSRSKLELVLVLKRAIGLKRSYGDAFGKLLVFIDKKYHTLKNIDTKTQILD